MKQIYDYSCEDVFDALIHADDLSCTIHIRADERRDLLRGIEWLRAAADNPYNEHQTALWNALQAVTEHVLEGRSEAPKEWQYARPEDE